MFLKIIAAVFVSVGQYMAAVTGTILILSSINTGVSLQVESLYHEESWPVEFLVLCLV